MSEDYKKVIRVSQIPREAMFISNSQDVDDLKMFLPGDEQDYDSFFVLLSGDGDYEAIWGMYGIVPELNKKVFKVI